MDCYWSLFNNRDKARFDGLRTLQARSIVRSIPPGYVADWLAWKEGTAEWVALSAYPELFAPLADDTASHLSLGDVDAPGGGMPSADTGLISLTATKSHVTNHTVSDPNFEFSSQSEFNSGMADEDEDAERESTRTNTKSFQHLDARDLPDGSAPASKPASIASSPSSGPSPQEEFHPNVERVVEIEDAALEIADIEESAFNIDKRKSTRYRRKLEAEVELGGKMMKARTIDLSLGGCQIDQPLPTGLAKKHVKIRLIKGRDRIEAFCQVVSDKAGRPTNRFRFLDVDRIDLLRTWLISPG